MRRLCYVPYIRGLQVMHVPVRPRSVVDIAMWAAFVAVIAMAAFCLVTMLALDWEYGTVLSDSMEPTYSHGDVAVVRPCPSGDIEEGDILCFLRDGKKVTHRVVERQDTPAGIEFVTKGDANDDPDNVTVKGSQVIGKLIFHIPRLGFLFDFAQRPIGILAMICVPAVLLAVISIKEYLSRQDQPAGRKEAQ